MFAAFFLFCSLFFAENPALALQIALDREGFSSNTIDGQWGRKSELALAAYEKARGLPALPPEQALNRFFSENELFRIETVTQADLDALVKIPEEASAKAALPRMGYESIREMFAERGHLSQISLAQMNPGVDWDHVAVGTKLVIPDFPSIDDELKPSGRRRLRRPAAALVRVSISRCLITAHDGEGRVLAQFPCSIAANRAKVPAHGELRMTHCVAWPNYTYTPDRTPPGKKVSRSVWPAGENCPVGVAWMGLNLPGYGIHGTPRPESVGFTGSHGCFRLANWNAARLFAMCKTGTRVLIEP